MTFKQRSWIVPAVIISGIIELFVDSMTPLGTADYIFYFLPVAITVMHHRSVMPLFVAGYASVLISIGYFVSPMGPLQNVAVINRVFAAVVIWIVAFMVQMIIKARQEIVENDWIKTGENELTNRIRGELSVMEIGSAVLGYFSEYARLKAGALFIYDEQKNLLNLASGHAFTAHEGMTIRLGEGLVGQCAKDQKPKELQQVSNHYLKISSGLGSEEPQSLILAPLIANRKLVGVIEMAFRHQDLNRTKELLEQTAESVAIAIQSSQSRSVLKQLLSQAQALTEELQAQQEELRVSNEELEQQSKALRESQLKLENQQAELEQSNQQLEEQAQILEHQKLMVDEKNRALQISHLTLEEKSAEVARASQYKSEFLANMSHELRTPLNSTLILAKLLSDNKPGTMTEEQRKYADIIYDSGNDLLNLINDILDLSKVEAGKMEIEPEVVKLESLKKGLDSTFRAQAMLKNLEYKIEIDPLLPASIITDRQKLEQILKNFLSNAFKFTEKGLIHLQISPDELGVAFAITDSGIGIPLEQQNIIFEAFRQADGTSNRKYGGTGLGLSISKEFSHLLGGEIYVKSTQGKGSTFTLKLPLEVKKEQSPEKIKNPSVEIAPRAPTETPVSEAIKFSFTDDRKNLSDFKRRILIIEDDEQFAKVLYDHAHELEFGAVVAPTAEEGLRLCKEHSPHAVLLDMRLPDHNGFIVIDQLKMDPHTRHIPVHVISSDDFSKSALEMGAIGYLIKPVKREQLQKAFHDLTSLMSKTQKSVLVVEDDEVQRNHIVDLISDDYVNVDAVSLGKDALERLATKTYDCMITDLSLPDMTGHELLSELSNETEAYSYPPVIVYTARDLTSNEEEKLRQYSGSIIIKGAKSPERLLSEVTLFLHRVETELPPERQKMLKDLRNREKTLVDRKILIVDDDVRNIFALTGALESFGAQITVARNGREAIEKVSSTPGLDMVLMDIMMPEMDGHEAMRALRANKRFEKLPIIALTAKAMKDDHQKCLESGANDYLAKPINMDKLLSLIRVWLPSQRGFFN